MTLESGFKMQRFYRWKELRKYVPYSRSHVTRMVNAGTFPRPYKLSPGCAVWSEAQIAEWLRERTEK
jgi:prophage regulatory protein